MAKVLVKHSLLHIQQTEHNYCSFGVFPGQIKLIILIQSWEKASLLLKDGLLLFHFLL